MTTHAALSILEASSVALITSIVTGCVCMVVALRSNQYLSLLRRGAQRLANGDLSQPLPTAGPSRLAGLAESMNSMSAQLKNRLQTVLQQRNELEAVLGSMAEGVLAVDLDERVIKINPAAARLLDIDPSWAMHRSIQETVRNTALQQTIAQALQSGKPVLGEVTLRLAAHDRALGMSVPLRVLEVQGTSLRDDHRHRIGTLIVLHDVTDLRRLETIRRDFVANASHEIKTPVTAIKAAVETLLDGTGGPSAEAGQFLKMIARQADRLHALVEDLLTLARVEQADQQHRIELANTLLAPVMQAAAESCQIMAKQRGVDLDVNCAPHLRADLNRPLLEQAIVNLVDNAIKYSPNRGVVHLEGIDDHGEVIICVRDHGCGIDPKHHSRIFERFYRPHDGHAAVRGGTGLGLAIVKHITTAHGGRVTVSSTPGQGSEFRIHLPVRHGHVAEPTVETSEPRV